MPIKRSRQTQNGQRLTIQFDQLEIENLNFVTNHFEDQQQKPSSDIGGTIKGQSQMTLLVTTITRIMPLLMCGADMNPIQCHS